MLDDQPNPAVAPLAADQDAPVADAAAPAAVADAAAPAAVDDAVTPPAEPDPSGVRAEVEAFEADLAEIEHALERLEADRAAG